MLRQVRSILVLSFSLPLYGHATTLEQTLSQVLEANLRVQVSQLDYDIAGERAKAEWSIFEPKLLLTLAQEANNRENTTQQFLSQRVGVFDEKNDVYSVAVEGVIPTGATVRLGSQVRALSNNLISSSKEEWESYSGVTLTQPLLKNRGWEVVSTQIRLSASDSKVALQNYRGQLALVLSEAEMAYWELAAANLLVELSQGSVETAEVILKDNLERFDAGKTTELEVLRAQAGLALRKANYEESGQRRVDAASRLNAFLGRKANEGPRLVPSEKLEGTGSTLPATEALLQSFESHPAYLAQKERCEQAGIRLVYAKNEKLPQLDLKASYGFNGLGNNLKGTYDQGFIKRDFPSWYLGLELSYPLTNGKRERHQLAAAQLRKRQALLELSAIEIDLINGIHVLVDKVESLRSRGGAMSQVVDLQKRVLDNEHEYLKAGKSESRKVLEAEEDLSNALLESLSARLELRRSTVDLLVRQGTYLSQRGFELSELGEE